MKIYVRSRNGGKEYLTAKQIELVKEFIEWVMIKFVSKRTLNNVEITLILDAMLFERTGSLGFGVWEDKHKRGRVFTVEIETKDQTFMNILHSIAHEIVHVKQWVKGELYSHRTEKNTYFFMGQKINEKKLDDTYWDLPWEIEAHGRSTGLILQWIKKCGHVGARWTLAQLTY